MSRTIRDIKGISNKCFRQPKTHNQVKQLNGLLHDPDLKELGVNLPNRYNRYIPNSYDDLHCSALSEVHKSKQP